MKTLVSAALTATLLASSLYAQESRVEVGVVGGYTFSDGVSISPVSIGDEIFNEVFADSGFSYGVSFDIYLTENVQVGFLWDQQRSSFSGKGTVRREFANMNVNNYHAIFTYNWGSEDAEVRPYIFGGLGATNYAPGEVKGRDIMSSTRFSSTWGGGLKVFPSSNAGVKLGVRWTPTYIKSDPSGIWCSPYWGPYFPGGCWVLEDPDYANQFELFGGFQLRF